MKDFDVQPFASTSLADYYKIGTDPLVTVSARHANGKHVCHTCRKNECEHVDAVLAYEAKYGTPEQQAERAAQAVSISSIDLSEVEL